MENKTKNSTEDQNCAIIDQIVIMRTLSDILQLQEITNSEILELRKENSELKELALQSKQQIDYLTKEVRRLSREERASAQLIRQSSLEKNVIEEKVIEPKQPPKKNFLQRLNSSEFGSVGSGKEPVEEKKIFTNIKD